MKQLLVIAIALTSVNAFATRARMAALNNAPRLVDTQSIYNRPTDIFAIGSDLVTIESGLNGGAAASAQNTNPEGMIVRTMGDAKVALSLGHQSRSMSSWGMRSIGATGGAGLNVNQQNPIEFTYGMKSGGMNLAGTLVYSTYNNKIAGATFEKENSTALILGANEPGVWSLTANLGLVNSVQGAAGKFTGTSDMTLAGAYTMGDLWWYARFSASGAKVENAANVETAKQANQSLTVGPTHSIKNDGNELFYSAMLMQTETKDDVATTKTTTLSLPITIGVEIDAASWLTLRGSVSQSTLINNSKSDTGAVATAEVAPGANSTTAAFGAGLKFNKLTFDGTLLTGTAGGQTLESSGLLARAGMTYWF